MSNPKFQLLALRLQGENTPEGRIRSIQAFTDFKHSHMIGQVGGSQMVYTDNEGHIAFNLVLLVDAHYPRNSFTGSWEKICQEAGVKPATSYEVLMDFEEVLHSGYVLRSEGK